MFMKSPTRNEPITRKDVKSVLSGTGLATASSAPNAAPNSPPQSAPNSPLNAAPAVAAGTGPAAAQPEEGLRDARLIVGPEVKLKGAEILDCDTLVVEGRVEATMDSRVIRIAENGMFSGKVSIDVAEVHGHFEGELTARLQLIIHATGRVSGKIRYGKLVIDEGGELSGDINLLNRESAAPVRPRDETLPVLSAVAG